jgi:ATP-dependent DNA ligase
VDTKSRQKVLSEIQKNAAFLGDKSKLRPWIRLDVEVKELDNLLEALLETGIDGVLIRSYEVATEEKLDAIHKFIGS